MIEVSEETGIEVERVILFGVPFKIVGQLSRFVPPLCYICHIRKSFEV